MTDLYLQSDGRDMTLWVDEDPPRALLTEHAADDLLWAHLVATLPTRDEPQDEPTDPGVRVWDKEGDEWARFGDAVWASPGLAARSWNDLNDDYGPLKIIQPDAPSADERPFRVGDRVLIAEGARTDDGDDRGMSVYFVGRQGIYQGVSMDGSALVCVDGRSGWRVGHSFLTHADAPC